MKDLDAPAFLSVLIINEAVAAFAVSRSAKQNFKDQGKTGDDLRDVRGWGGGWKRVYGWMLSCGKGVDSMAGWRVKAKKKRKGKKNTQRAA